MSITTEEVGVRSWYKQRSKEEVTCSPQAPKGKFWDNRVQQRRLPPRDRPSETLAGHVDLKLARQCDNLCRGEVVGGVYGEMQMFNLLTIIVDAIHCWRGNGMAETRGTGTRDTVEGYCETGPTYPLSHALACGPVKEDNANK